MILSFASSVSALQDISITLSTCCGNNLSPMTICHALWVVSLSWTIFPGVLSHPDPIGAIWWSVRASSHRLRIVG